MPKYLLSRKTLNLLSIGMKMVYDTNAQRWLIVLSSDKRLKGRKFEKILSKINGEKDHNKGWALPQKVLFFLRFLDI